MYRLVNDSTTSFRFILHSKLCDSVTYIGLNRSIFAFQLFMSLQYEVVGEDLYDTGTHTELFRIFVERLLFHYTKILSYCFDF